MQIFVKAKPNSNTVFLNKSDENHFEISVKEPPIQGLANQAIMRVLSTYFGVPVSQIRLVRGYRERNKIFEVRTSTNSNNQKENSA